MPTPIRLILVISALAVLASATSSAELSARLSELGQLHDSGAVSTDELAFARAEALRAYAAGSTTSDATALDAADPSAGPFTKLVWSDDFSTGFDLSKWKHEITASGGGNWEFEYVDDEEEREREREKEKDIYIYTHTSLVCYICGPVLCCAVLCCAVRCCAVLCCAVLCVQRACGVCK